MPRDNPGSVSVQRQPEESRPSLQFVWPTIPLFLGRGCTDTHKHTWSESSSSGTAMRQVKVPTTTTTMMLGGEDTSVHSRKGLRCHGPRRLEIIYLRGMAMHASVRSLFVVPAPGSGIPTSRVGFWEGDCWTRARKFSHTGRKAN